MSLRIAFDLDGVLADFAAAYGRIAGRLFPESLPRTVSTEAGAGGDRQAAAEGRPASRAIGEDAGRASAEALPGDVRLSPRRRDRVWREIRSTPDFWLTLEPMDPAVVARLHERAVARRWETFFVTRRPATAGDTVQRQTQRWLVEQGFALPSVVVHDGSRGRLAAALELDFLVDDTVQHCVDVVSQSSSKAVLVAPEADAATEANARRLGIEVCPGPAAALDLIDAAASGRLTAFLLRARRAIRARQTGNRHPERRPTRNPKPSS